MKINEFARLCECKEYTLRYYDKIGLLKPERISDRSGYRHYSLKQKVDYIEIKELQEIGFTIEEIKRIKSLSNKEITILIQNKIFEINNKIIKANKLLEKYRKE